MLMVYKPPKPYIVSVGRKLAARADVARGTPKGTVLPHPKTLNLKS